MNTFKTFDQIETLKLPSRLGHTKVLLVEFDGIVRL